MLDRASFYRVARGSATELAASLDELVDFGFLLEHRISKAKQLSLRIVSMLVNLIRSTQAAESPREIPPTRDDSSRRDVHVLGDPARARRVADDPD